MKDVTETFYSCKHSALDFIKLASSIKSGSNSNPKIFDELFKYILKSLQDLKETPSYDFRIKDAYLTVIEHLSIVIKQLPIYNEHIENMLIEFWIPGLFSENSIEKYRALSLYFNYSYLPLTKEIRNMDNQKHLFIVAELIFKLLSDQEIVVKITASSALYRLMKKPQLKNELSPNLGTILNTYFSLMNEIDSEDLVFALKEIVTIFKDIVEPYSLQICSQLEESYWKLYNTEDEEIDELSDGAIACLSTTKNIFECTTSCPDLLIKLEKQWIKMLISTTTPYTIGGIDYTLDCLTIVQFYSKSVSEEMISIIPKLLIITAGNDQEISGGFALEYFTQMENFFKNIILLSFDQLLWWYENETSYFELIFQALNKIIDFSSDQYNNTEGIVSIRIICSMAENWSGKI